MTMTVKHILKAFIFILTISMAAGCQSSWEDEFMIDINENRENPGNRVETDGIGKVLLLYSAGYNNLSGYLNQNVRDLKQGWLPRGRRSDDAVLVYSHSPSRSGEYGTPTSPYLVRLYSDIEGNVISDTLVTYPKGTISASAEQLNNVLSYVRDNFKAKSYGMVVSTHATGYLPPRYYSKSSGIGSRSIGSDFEGNFNRIYHEIELKEFAEAIPMKLDYIIFDACLMGGVEVAYELRDKCDRIGFSQAEVLAWGLNYKDMTKHLLQEREPNPQGVCEDFYAQYENKTGANRSATISLADTRLIEELATICMILFDKYRDRIHNLNSSEVQDFGGNKLYFYDLVDILRAAGANETELADLQQAVDEVIPYKETTESYYSDTDDRIHPIDPAKFSGLTMYMPKGLGTELDRYYKTLDWNVATGLVE